MRLDANQQVQRAVRQQPRGRRLVAGDDGHPARDPLAAAVRRLLGIRSKADADQPPVRLAARLPFADCRQIEQIDRLLHGLRIIAVVLERSEEHTSELQSLMRISYAVFCLQQIKQTQTCTMVYTK